VSVISVKDKTDAATQQSSSENSNHFNEIVNPEKEAVARAQEARESLAGFVAQSPTKLGFAIGTSHGVDEQGWCTTCVVVVDVASGRMTFAKGPSVKSEAKQYFDVFDSTSQAFKIAWSLMNEH